MFNSIMSWAEASALSSVPIGTLTFIDDSIRVFDGKSWVKVVIYHDTTLQADHDSRVEAVSEYVYSEKHKTWVSKEDDIEPAAQPQERPRSVWGGLHRASKQVGEPVLARTGRDESPSGHKVS